MFATYSLAADEARLSGYTVPEVSPVALTEARLAMVQLVAGQTIQSPVMTYRDGALVEVGHETLTVRGMFWTPEGFAMVSAVAENGDGVYLTPADVSPAFLEG